MAECSYTHLWPYTYPNRRYDEATYWNGFTYYNSIHATYSGD